MKHPPKRHAREIFLPSIFILLLSLFQPLTAHAVIQEGLSDEELLETIARKSFDFFVRERNPKTGLVSDRAHNFQRGATSSSASIASTGFGLAVLGVGAERGWMHQATLREMARRTLQFFYHSASQEHGFFYHFLDMETGERIKNSELSPIDTALFLAGALFVAEYFDDAEMRDLAAKIYERIDFPWMLHEGDTLALAWSPESGFHKLRWDHYNESLILYLLAIGSPTHPISEKSWKAISRPSGSYRDIRLIQMPPLFTHQYSHIFIDFRDQNDGYADYFKNSVNATLANRAFVMDHASKFKSYGPNSWGLTASDGPFGYKAYGAPPGWAIHDGTIAPTGCGSSIVFTPKESIACLRYFYEELGERLWGMYGFSDAFNLDKKWFDQEVIGIDQGALLLMIENYRSGLIWDIMKRNFHLQQAMSKVGFKPGTMEMHWPQPPEFEAPYVAGGIRTDGYLKDWSGAPIRLNRPHRESGSVKNDEDLSAEIRFAWDEEALYFALKATDESVLVRKSGKNIWQDDLLELYIDPAGDGLFWGDRRDFQLGFRAHDDGDQVETWSWFQGGEDPAEDRYVAARGFVHPTGYIIEGAVRWSYLGIIPETGMAVNISPALHDIDTDRTEGKLHWFFRNEERLQRFVLGKIILKKGAE